VYRPLAAVSIQRAAPAVYRPAAEHVLMMKPGVIQRTIASAAKALADEGEITVKRSMFTRSFCKDHEVALTNLAAIQGALDALRAARPVQTTKAPLDITVPGNRPTTGGMVEEDATKLAKLNGWELSATAWRCSDTSHTPKGKVYTNGTHYYGADNAGHVGWGFKVWSKKNKTTLDYEGNFVWGGAAWKHLPRGTATAT
jgi:hypothetical protein